MFDSLSQAQAAAAQEDWSTLVSILHRLCLSPPEPTSQLDVSAELLSLALTVLEAGDFQAQWEVAKVFPSFGRAAIAPLITLLQDDTAELEARWYAARILGELHDTVAIQALVEQLQATEDEDLKDVVAEALANLGPVAITALTELLAAEPTRSLALKALAQIHQPATVTPLLLVIDDPDPAIRSLALEALSSFDDPRLPEVFVRAVKDPAAQVRRAAIAGLGRHRDWLASGQRVTALVNCLWDLNLGVCQQAALALGKIGTEEAVPFLKRALAAQNTPLALQLDVILALSWIGSESALSSLQGCLPPHGAPVAIPVVQEVVTRLGRWSEPTLYPRIVQSLEAVLQSGADSLLRRTIATALGELKHPNGLDPLIQLLADPDATVRLHAIVALQQLDPVAAYTRLTQLQSSQDLSASLRDGVIVALREWKAQLPH